MFVITYTEEGSPRRAVLPSGDTVVGRSPACDIVIDDVSVSRRHAKFTMTPDGCTLSDLSSRNGTYVNGRRIHRTHRIRVGDILRFGDNEYRFDGYAT